MAEPGRVDVRTVKFSEVLPMPENPRIIDDVAMRGLRASLDRFGYVEPVVWNERTQHIVGGHQRYKVLVGQGLLEAPMVVVDMSPEEEMAANLTLNNPEIEGQFSPSVVELLQALQGVDSDLFEKLRMDDLMGKLEKRFEPGKDKPFVNREVDIGGLIADCDARCPCCGFVWKSDENDLVDLEALHG